VGRDLAQSPLSAGVSTAAQQNRSLVPVERIERAILVFRGHKVMLDEDLADLYGVETRALVQATKRNADRFPIGRDR